MHLSEWVWEGGGGSGTWKAHPTPPTSCTERQGKVAEALGHTSLNEVVIGVEHKFRE